ncbi:DUF1365 domain-containing protein [Stella sp.]|uniref:DUF1365 domain-containing protein n=1 Tax=Stella sp. TaxID=2912054 RepID=UPI0035AF0169
MTADPRRSALYLGRVMHRRVRPFVHGFRYRVYALLVDLDELPVLDRDLRLFAYNRAGLFSFHDRDHGPRDGSPLRPWIEAQLAAAGMEFRPGRIALLCFPRVLGYVFNPLSVYFCHDRDGRLGAILYEVRNTFGEQHGYLLPVGDERPDGWVRQTQDKRFYVSPFLPMECRYAFRILPPGERLAVLIRQTAARPEGDVEVLAATLTGERRPLDDAWLARMAVALPLLTLKVLVAIHWQALRLWRKGARFHRRPDPPPHPVTYEPQPPRPGIPT